MAIPMKVVVPISGVRTVRRDAVEHDDATESGVQAGVEEGRQAGAHSIPGRRLGRRCFHDAGDDLVLDRLVDGAEQRLLP